MYNSQLSVGVFDSGMGGLTVLRALRVALPKESFIYLGDTARLPYGTKSSHTVRQYAVQMAKILLERQIKALVIACNTATTAALPYLQAMTPDIPVIGVVCPGAASAVAATQNKRISVFATETTIASQAYQQLILREIPDASISVRPCSLLVALAEEGMVNNDVATAAVKHYISKITNEDTLLLGCTHFPVFKPLLSRLLPPEITIVDSAEATANTLRIILEQKNLLETNHSSIETRYLVTDSVERFRVVGEIFLGQSLAGSDIELIDA
ncbi:MAG: glutamate racemase [Legionella sp.]